MENITSLLNQVKAIVRGYAAVNQHSQDHFNIFRVLQLQSDEVRLHSTLLAELLNPKGSHRKGAVFLEKFIQTVIPSQTNVFNWACARVTAERFIGVINEDQTQGGRIDIYVEDDLGHVILIENKIYAGDQPKQLLRYYNHLKGKKGTVLYLTLKGNDASQESKVDLKEETHYSRISYKQHIVSWLEQCHQLASDAPNLRETIRQYINLLKNYTGQSTNKRLHMDIKETILLNPENLTSAYYINANFKQAKNALLKGFWTEVAERLRVELGEGYEIHLKDNMEKNYPALFVNEKDYFERWQFHFVLEPLNGKSAWMPNCLYYGIWCNNRHTEVQQAHARLLKLFNEKTRNPKWWLQLNIVGDLDFANINTLKRILPSTPEREEIQGQIIRTLQAYILENAKLMRALFKMIIPFTHESHATTSEAL